MADGIWYKSRSVCSWVASGLRGAVAVVRRCDCCKALSEKLQKCAGCEVATYCSKDCQRLHWRAGHKNNCKTFSKASPLSQDQIDAMLVKAEEESSDNEEDDDAEDGRPQARITNAPAKSGAS